MLPYSLVMLLILVLSSFLVFGITDEVSTLAIGKIRYIGVELIGCTSMAFMYIIPIALCIGMFGFIHKKNYTDFILSSPVKRSSVYFTNIVSGFVMISVMLAVNLLFIALVISAGENYQAYVSASDYILSFFYNLAGYMLVFAVSSFAAILTGTAITQAYMTFIILLLPAFIAAYVQLPFLIQPYTSFMTSQYTIPLNQIFLIPNIPAMPITMAMLEASG
jgi:ABC-2 type transport system permease protein